jgi:DNA uptake protein ComE-like DNA-binding protein
MAGKQRKIFTGLWIAGLSFSLLAMGCTSHPTDAQLKQQAEQTTQQVKQDAQQAAANTRAAAANAEDKIDAVAAGVKEGLNGQSSPRIDLNTASRGQLETLPGISPARAGRIIAARPYSSPDDLVGRNILTQGQFERISGKVKIQVPAS